MLVVPGVPPEGSVGAETKDEGEPMDQGELVLLDHGEGECAELADPPVFVVGVADVFDVVGPFQGVVDVFQGVVPVLWCGSVVCCC